MRVKVIATFQKVYNYGKIMLNLSASWFSLDNFVVKSLFDSHHSYQFLTSDGLYALAMLLLTSKMNLKK